MSPKVWLPVIVVFIVVLVFAGLRLITMPPQERGAAVHADGNIASSLLNHLMGPKSDDEN